jgi:hypothetical protein
MISGDDVSDVDAGPSDHSEHALVSEVLQVLAATGQPVVSLAIDGLRVAASFDLNEGEHHRRSLLGVGPVTSLSLLHSLWMIPAGGFVPARSLPSAKVALLRTASDAAVETNSGFERLYSPPGFVRSIGFAGRHAENVISQAIRFTPIFQRVAVLPQSVKRPSSALLATAREWGVGVYYADAIEVETVVEPAEAVRGRPAVYRWWIAELAYRSWLQRNTQLVS